MLNILYNITILESSIFFHHDHVTVRVLCDSDIILDPCHIQVHLFGNNVPAVKPPPNHTSLSSTAATFLTTCLMAVLQPLDILSSMAEILLFNLVFHDRVTPVSVSTLKPPLGAIGVLPLKPRASPILSVCI